MNERFVQFSSLYFNLVEPESLYLCCQQTTRKESYMNISQIKIGEKCRILQFDSDETIKGQIGIVEKINISQYPSATYITLLLNDDSHINIPQTELAPILSIDDFDKIYASQKILQTYEDIMIETIESILHLLNKHYVYNMQYEFDYDKTRLYVTGEDENGNSVIAESFPLRYLYEENWYQEYREKLCKEAKTEINVNERIKDDYEYQEYIRLKKKFEHESECAE